MLFLAFNFIKSNNQKNIINSNFKRVYNQVYRVIHEKDVPKKVWKSLKTRRWKGKKKVRSAGMSSLFTLSDIFARIAVDAFHIILPDAYSSLSFG